MNDIPDIEKVKIDYEKVKEAGEKRTKSNLMMQEHLQQ